MTTSMKSSLAALLAGALLCALPAFAQAPAPAPPTAAAAPVEAAPAPRIRVGMVAVPERSADANSALLIQALFREELKNLQNADLVLPNGDIDAAALIPVSKLVDEGARMLRASQFREALKPYQTAAAILEKYTGLPNRRLMARAYKGLAIAQWMDGEKILAKTNAQRSLLLWPAQSDGEWAYNLDATRLMREVRVGWDTAPDGSIVVQSRPQQAEIFVDGVSRGYTPRTLQSIPAGSHHVYIVKDGYEPFWTWADVAPEQSREVSGALSPIGTSRAFSAAMRRLPRAVKRPRQARSILDSIAVAHGGLDMLFAGSVRSKGDSFDLRGVFHRDEEPVRAVDERLARDAYLIGNVRGLVRSLYGLEYAPDSEQIPLETPVAGGAAAPEVELGGEDVFIKSGTDVFADEKKEEEAGIFTRWWFWTGAAVVVGGTVAAILLATGGESGSKGPTGKLSLTFNSPVAP